MVRLLGNGIGKARTVEGDVVTMLMMLVLDGKAVV